MTSDLEGEGSVDLLNRNQVRIWPGIIIVSVQWLLRFGLLLIKPEAMMAGILGEVICTILLVIWWIIFSRAHRIERWIALPLIILSLWLTSFLIDESIAKAMMGYMFLIFSVPVMSLAFVLWASVTRRMTSVWRTVMMIITIVLASGIWICLRTNGMTGDGRQLIGWRWSATSEDRMLEHTGKDVFAPYSNDVKANNRILWAGFRGSNRDGIIYGSQLKTDWKEFPPVELWRKPVGPGCSSFAVDGNLIYTQEQRGEYEAVSCYQLETGKAVWIYKYRARFYEPHAGAGPRATPSISGNRIYTLGATGILNCLNISDGSLIWSRNAALDAGEKTPLWGFSGSPLITTDAVIAAISGTIVSYDRETGQQMWTGPDGGQSYSSPVLLNMCGIRQVVFMSDSGAVGLNPENGTKLWDYPWKIEGRILQPSVIDSSDLLLCGEYKAIRRISFDMVQNRFKITEKWNSSSVKNVFNDFVIDKGFAYGFDGPYLTCTNLSYGKMVWKGDRYQGFPVLIADQDLILVLTEKGEVALVKASPEKFTELSRFNAIKGKTWSHPVLAGNILVVRNGDEMAAFRF